MKARLLSYLICTGLASFVIAYAIFHRQVRLLEAAIAKERAVSAKQQAEAQDFESRLAGHRICNAAEWADVGTLIRNQDYSRALWKTDSALMMELWMIQQNEDAAARVLQAYPLEKDFLLTAKAYVFSETYGFDTNRILTQLKPQVMSFLLKVK